MGSPETPAPSPGASPKGTVLFVTSDKVNLRACPAANCKVIAVLKRGDEVIKIGQDDAWVNVRAKALDREGWVSSKMVGKKPRKKSSPEISEEWSPQGKAKKESPALKEEFSP
jgi:uncharacterized protein YgiM (DUF1202 family)